MKCPECGNQNEAGARFCASCGAKLAPSMNVSAEPDERLCPGCGKTVGTLDRFCEHCGSPVAAPQPAAPVTPPQSADVSLCPRCQAVNSANSRFCESCGAQLQPLRAPAAAPSAGGTPQGISVELARALRARDRARKRGTPAEELELAEAEVSRAKTLVRARLNEVSAEIEGLRREQGAQEAKYRAGEYTEVQYRNATADLRRRIAALERLEESFAALLRAETEDELLRPVGPAVSIGVTSPKAARDALAKELPRERVTETVRSELSPAREFVAKKKGRNGIPAPKWMLIGSGVVIAASLIAVVVLALQAFSGPFGLPSLTGLFNNRGGGAVTPPPTAATSPPATAAPTASPAPVGAEFQVPIQLRGAQDLGSLFVEMQYDAAEVEFVRLDAAALPPGTLFEYGAEQGRVAIALVNSNGLMGDWALAFITCRRASGAAMSGDSTLILSEIQAHTASDLSEVPAYGTDGHVNLSTLAVATPTITIG